MNEFIGIAAITILSMAFCLHLSLWTIGEMLWE